MDKTIVIRTATAADFDELAEIMFDAVRCGPSEYTEQQRFAWVPTVRSGRDWERRLSAQTIFVAS